MSKAQSGGLCAARSPGAEQLALNSWRSAPGAVRGARCVALSARMASGYAEIAF